MPTEPTLFARVEGAIQANSYLSGRRLRFEAEGGRVVLQGVVATYFQKQMAQEIVRRIEGVQQIDNHLEVTWLKSPALDYGRRSEASHSATEALSSATL